MVLKFSFRLLFSLFRFSIPVDEFCNSKVISLNHDQQKRANFAKVSFLKPLAGFRWGDLRISAIWSVSGFPAKQVVRTDVWPEAVYAHDTSDAALDPDDSRYLFRASLVDLNHNTYSFLCNVIVASK